MKKLLLVTAAVALIGGALTACETETPYQPLAPGAASSGGYSDVRIEANRWRVTFQGNSMTARQTVENYLLYRAAELTIAQGFDWFEATQRNTDKHTETYVDPDFGPYGYGWRPYWRYYGGGFGWRGWDPYFGGPFWADNMDVHTIEKYEASAEVIMGHGPKPTTERHAFDAREVMANLGGHVIRPR